jgi:antitoxin HicB
MEEFAYPVVLSPAAEGGFVVSFQDVPEALTQGEDEAEALVRAVDALETALEFYVAEGKPLPRPSAAKRAQALVRPPALSCLKLAVYGAMADQKVRKTDLAKRLGWHLMQIDRLLDLEHASRIDQVEAALAALGRQVTIRVSKAA